MRSITKGILAVVLMGVTLGIGVVVTSTHVWHIASPSPTPPATAPTRGSKDYETVRQALLRTVAQQDPRHALTELRDAMAESPTILNSCHPLAHDIGRAAFEKYQDFAKAITFREELCNSGYLHGVIEARFSRSPDIFSALHAVCTPYSSHTFLGWECFHGIGHGLMYYTANDLPRAIAWCDSFNDPPERNACTNGVFMENFNTNQKLHPSQYLDARDPFYPCGTERPENKESCYLYAPSYFLALHPENFSAALTWCLTIATPYQNSCSRGVGGEAMKTHLNEPLAAEALCMKGSASQRDACINGMVDLYINHYGTLGPARALCPQLQARNKKICEETVQARSSLFAH